MALIYLSCAWIGGILAGAVISPPPLLILVSLSPLLLLHRLRRHRRTIILVSLTLAAFLGGAVRLAQSQPPLDETQLNFYNGQSVVVHGTVASDPERGDRSVQIRLAAMEIEADQGTSPVAGNVLIITPPYAAYSYGDRLIVSGPLETPPQFDGFNYQAYLASKGIRSTMLYPHIEAAGGRGGFAPLAKIYEVRKRLAQGLARTLPEPQASLAQGIILGIRGGIPPDIEESFSRSGAAHLLAISGLHLGILAGSIIGAAVWLLGKRRYVYVWLTMGAVWTYVCLSGIHPPVVRAAIMVSLFLIAELLGRQKSAITALALAAAVMVGLNPGLLWSASFQMSFMAMVGLIYIAPLLQRVFRRAVESRWGKEGVGASWAHIAADGAAVSIGTLIAVGPLIALYFGIVSLIAPLTNLLALPTLPATITACAAAAVGGLAVSPAAQVIAWPAWLLTSYLTVVTEAMSAAPKAYIETATDAGAWLGGYYATLTAALFVINRRQTASAIAARAAARLRQGLSGNLARRLVPLLMLAAAAVGIAHLTMPDSRLHVSFLDVGQGDAILIQRGTTQILVDGGPSGHRAAARLGEKTAFWDRSIELMILTHPSTDHVTGLTEVLNRYDVKRVMHPQTDFRSGAYETWLKAVEAEGAATVIAQRGQLISIGDEVTIEVLNPPNPPLAGTYSDVDNNAIVLKVTMGQVSFLLTADLMQEGEWDIAAAGANLNSTVLKAGHHGSKTSSNPDFLAAVAPRTVVISVGGDNTYGHPHNEVTGRLVEAIGTGNIYRTDEMGTVEFITNGERLWVTTDR